MRQIVLDTETTGLEPKEGHRIIEVGCVELIDRKLTGRHFHYYINPERDIDAGAVAVHGLSREFLADKPCFRDIVDELWEYLKGAELVIHNAAFDMGFLNHELRLLKRGYPPLEEVCTVLDTLALAKKKHPGQRNNLDALCKRYGVNNQHRELHGALLDAEILAEVYLTMTGGQTLLSLEPDPDLPHQTADTLSERANLALSGDRPPLRVIRCSEAELAAHASRLADIAKASGDRCLWLANG